MESTIVINGVGTPRIIAIKGGVETTIDLPRCQEMTEIFTPEHLLHKIFRRRKKTKFYGWSYRCILDYSTFATGNMLDDLRPALNRGESDRLILIPRKDAPGFQYNVFFVEPINLSLFGKSAGYRKPVFVFDAEDLVASFPIRDGYGTHYGTLYGNMGW